jgi:hypothetical protein
MSIANRKVRKTINKKSKKTVTKDGIGIDKHFSSGVDEKIKIYPLIFK